MVRRRLATAACARLESRSATDRMEAGGLSIRGQRGFCRLQPIERAGRRFLASKPSGFGEVEGFFRAGLEIGSARRHDDALAWRSRGGCDNQIAAIGAEIER